MYLYIFFDLDGTIIDSQRGIFNSIRYALQTFSITVQDSRLSKFIGPPLLDGFQTVCGFTREQALEAVKKYREYYIDKGIFECTPYKGVPELLTDLAAAGKKLYLATSKPEIFAIRILEHFKLTGLFSGITGADLYGGRQSKEDVLRHACCSRNIPAPEKCVLVGDREYDVQGAAALGMPCLGVLYGYGSREELLQAGAASLCPTPGDVRARLLGQ